MGVTIDDISSAVLPPGSVLHRKMPRPVEHRQADYEEKFDALTVFCDVFSYGRRIVLSGPALLNMDQTFALARYRLGGILPMTASISDMWKTQRSRLSLPNTSKPTLALRRLLKSSLTVDAGTHRWKLKVQPDGAARFAGKKVLYTLQKNNDLRWIRDWARFYQSRHGVDSVILYDNASTDYGLDDIARTLSEVPGLDEVVVLSWPFPHGPGASRIDMWDSDFCQYTALEHMRWRYGRQAAAVINSDIDELVVCEDGRSIIEHMEERAAGVIYYHCRWVESVASREIGRDRTFTDFVYYDPERPRGTRKWTTRPSAMPGPSQFAVHRIHDGPKVVIEDAIAHRHFDPISTNWKRSRSQVKPLDADVHRVDATLVREMREAFGADGLPPEVT